MWGWFAPSAFDHDLGIELWSEGLSTKYFIHWVSTWALIMVMFNPLFMDILK